MRDSQPPWSRLGIRLLELIVPNVLCDVHNPRNRFGSTEVTSRLVDLAASEEYDEDVLYQVSRGNPAAVAALREYTTGETAELDDDSADAVLPTDEPAEEAVQWRTETKRRNALR